MTTKETSRDVAASTAQESITTTSIPSKAELRKMPLIKQIRLAKRLSAQQIVDTISELYPGFNRYLLSNVENPDKYGVDLQPPALSAAIAAHAPELAPKPRNKARRKKPRRFTFWLSESDYDELTRVITATGHPSAQSWFDVTIRRTLAAYRWNKKPGEK